MAASKSDKPDKAQVGSLMVIKRMAASKQILLKALIETRGVVTEACLAVGLSRDTHYRWMKSDRDYSKRVEEISEIAIDFVESEMFKHIKGGDTSLIKWFMSTKGRKRGYGYKSEHQVDVNLEVPESDITWRITSPSRVNGSMDQTNDRDN